MIRHHSAALLLSFALAMTLAGRARAAESPPPDYTVRAEATRVGDQILVKIAMEQSDAAGRAKKKAIARPHLMLLEGQRGSFEIGEEAPAANPVPPAPLKADAKSHPEPRRTPTTNPALAPRAAEIISGIKVDVISVKGQDKLLVVSTVVEKRETVWADAQTIKVDPEQSKQK